ncbi:MAG: lipopolysaccharide biosynthesis protein [Candidatus Omnitrophica bacterium]|nr:lipopolysaccharide biosynthesis protein [Candidatus Omnitrophota bacterium]
MLKKKIFTNTVFSVASQIVMLGFGVLLARILFPDDFGVFAISLLFVELASHFTLGGFSTAIVQKKEFDESYFGTVFFFGLCVSLCLGAVIFVKAPSIAHYFRMQGLERLLRWHVVVLAIVPMRLICSAKLYRDLKFKELGSGWLFSEIVKGIGAISFAFFGFGALSLVFGEILKALSMTLAYFYYKGKTSYRFFLSPNLGALRKLSHVGTGVMWQNIFSYAAGNADYFLLGKLTAASTLGFYKRAFGLMKLPVQQISRNVSGVLIPAFSRIQDDNKKIIHQLLKATQASSVIVFPLFLVLYIYAPSLMLAVYGERWMPSVVPLRILIFAGAIKAVSTYIGDVLKAKGVVYREALVQLGYVLILLIAGFFAVKQWSMIGISFVVVFASLVVWTLMIAILHAVLNISIRKYLRIFIPSLFICALLFAWNIFIKYALRISGVNIFYTAAGMLSSLILYVYVTFRIKNSTLFSSEINKLQKIIFRPFRKFKKSVRKRTK